MTEKECLTQLEAELERERDEKVVMRREMVELCAEAVILHVSMGEIDGHNHTNESG